jgi:DNA-binding transcriptional LysR family regulator
MNDEVRIADLKTFLAVHRSGSISSAARQLRVTPSQVSKAIARLEEHAGARLLARGARGISLTEQGHEIVPRVVSAIAAVGALKRTTLKASPPLEITVAGPSYLVTHLVPLIAAADPRLKVRGLELSPPHLRAYLTDNVFDLALLPGKVPSRPSAWTTDAVGELRMSLLGTKVLAQKLAPPTTVERLRTIPFVVPLVAPSDRFAPLDDGCPLPREERRVGHETQTIGSALELAASTQQLVFGPVIAARRLIDAGALVEIPVQGWRVSEMLNVLCNGSRVLAPVRAAVVRTLRAALAN